MEKIIIVGAGASGLMTGYLLSKQGYQIEIIEAQNQIGGRIKSKIMHSSSHNFLELGAEFVHGNLPTTLQLLHEAQIPYYKIKGEVWNYNNGNFDQNDDFLNDFELFHKRLNQLEADCSVHQFLEKEFKGEQYIQLRQSILNFVMGYDGADPNDMSIFSLRNENPENNEDEFTIEGGYTALMNYLFTKCKENGVNFYFSESITQANWKKGEVFLTSNTGRKYSAEKAIFTLSIALLQEKYIDFEPAIPNYISAANEIGVSHAIKFIFQFNPTFFKNTNIAQLNDLHLLLSDEEIPTWWIHSTKPTQLTGWLGGPKAFEMKDSSKKDLLSMALKTLSTILNISESTISDHLENWEITIPSADPFTKCAYSYNKINSKKAREIINTPLEKTLYFAGEALYNGNATGTVEAALVSGESTAKKIIN